MEILYTTGATLHPLFMCEELGQKETKECCFVLLFYEELGALAADEREKLEKKIKEHFIHYLL